MKVTLGKSFGNSYKVFFYKGLVSHKYLYCASKFSKLLEVLSYKEIEKGRINKVIKKDVQIVKKETLARPKVVQEEQPCSKLIIDLCKRSEVISCIEKYLQLWQF